MANSGTSSFDFGVFPGNHTATLVVTGQSGILAESLLGAWIRGSGTSADHSEDEHIVENVKITAGTIVAGVGFTIYGECLLGTNLYGVYNVSWAWS